MGTWLEDGGGDNGFTILKPEYVRAFASLSEPWRWH